MTRPSFGVGVPLCVGERGDIAEYSAPSSLSLRRDRRDILMSLIDDIEMGRCDLFSPDGGVFRRKPPRRRATLSNRCRAMLLCPKSLQMETWALPWSGRTEMARC